MLTRRGLNACDGRRMSPPQVPVVFELRLDSGEPIRGSLCLAGSAPRRFSGWLGLCAAVESLAGDPAPGERVQTSEAGRGLRSS